MTRPIIVIAVKDIQHVIPHFELSLLETHKSDARALLKNLGVDTEFGIEVQKGLTMRTKFCGVTETDRIVGLERVDKFWKQSGNASQECMEYSTDSTIKRELNKLKRGVFRVKQEQKENDE